jgi:MSHA biogenesis protein MshQ
MMPPVLAGEAVSGSVIVTLVPQTTSGAWNDYLNIDWDLDGDIDSDDSPSSIATFGIYRGNDRIIHWREVFNE